MIDYEKLGRLFEPGRGEPNEVPVLYDSKDLTTDLDVSNLRLAWKRD